MPSGLSQLSPVHPFPARMASSIVWRRLRRVKKSSHVLDPMAGSGTTVVVSRLLGHRAVGFDTDPLALLIAKAWSADVDPAAITKLAPSILARAIATSHAMLFRDAYPPGADEETRSFVRYWFDRINRRQLAALAYAIRQVKGQRPADRLLVRLLSSYHHEEYRCVARDGCICTVDLTRLTIPHL